MSRWFRGVVKQTPAMTVEEEIASLKAVEEALLLLVNDNITAADKILGEGESCLHHLGRGISSFIAAMLASEKELLKHTAVVLQNAENEIWEEMKRAEKDDKAFRSKIYAPGMEYLLAYSIAQLTGAICHVLSGSVTDALRGFYKLRKAHANLDSIMQAESKHLNVELAKHGVSSPSARQKTHATSSSTHGNSSTSIDKEAQFSESSSLKDGTISDNSSVSDDLRPVETQQTLRPVVTRTQTRILDVDPAAVGISSHIDIFIHSGTRLCYGMLLVIFSLIENPLFATILNIIGFQGDRERGIQSLWQASRFDNFNSAIAGISLLGFYNGLIGFCDILPTDEQGEDDLAGYPQKKCEALLDTMLGRYPHSKLWRLEEARKYAYNKNLKQAVQILVDNSDSGLKQIAVINIFELSLTSMYFHDYDLTARSWMQSTELSNWSPCMYSYGTGMSYLELYRNARKSDPKAAEAFKEKATEHFRRAPTLAGQQKVMSRELPFDTFIKRKVTKWETRAKAWGVDLVDATGVSPLTEMIYLWNGPKKQGKVELEKDIESLNWDNASHPEKFAGDLDEKSVHDVITACVWRQQGKVEEAEALLREGILTHDKLKFRGIDKDDWTHPTAYYEMAALAWVNKDRPGFDHKAKVVECEQWLAKVKDYGDEYLLDSRLSIKLSTSLITLKRHKRIMGF